MITKAKAPGNPYSSCGNWLDDSGEVVLPAIPEFMGVATQEKPTVWIVSIWRSG